VQFFHVRGGGSGDERSHGGAFATRSKNPLEQIKPS